QRADDVVALIVKDLEDMNTSQDRFDAETELFDWIRAGATIEQEKELYGYFAKFLQFVAERVRRLSRTSELDMPRPKRVVTAFERHDVKVDGAEQNYRPDIVIECTPIGQDGELVEASGSPKPRYENIFTVVEAKKTNSETNVRNACIQLILYMRE
ncbi:hypothetical protein LPJ53_006385, partial [Coemansia erecta]